MSINLTKTNAKNVKNIPTKKLITSTFFKFENKPLNKTIENININNGNPYKNIEYFKTTVLSTPIFT